MNTIPLVKGNTQEEINTSLIALKKALDEMNSSSSKTDASVQSQIKQINELIININSHLDTIDGQITDLQPVDEVTSGNMHAVTSNAVAECLSISNTEKEGGEYFGNRRYHKSFIYNAYLTPNVSSVLANNFEIPYNKTVGVDAFIISNNGVWSNDIKVYILSDGTLAVQSSTLGNNTFAIVIDFYYVK